MADSREMQRARAQWSRRSRLRRLVKASEESLSGCTGGNVCYGAPFNPGVIQDGAEGDAQIDWYERYYGITPR
jgi:hypothetical protein